MTEQMSLEAAIEAVLHHGPTFETIAGLCKMAVESSQKLADEPVAYIRVSKTGHVMACAKSGNFYALPDKTLLYTRPQPAAWVGLTEDEIHAIYDRIARQEPYSMAVTRRSIGRAIEQALKEKNT